MERSKSPITDPFDTPLLSHVVLKVDKKFRTVIRSAGLDLLWCIGIYMSLAVFSKRLAT